MATATATAKTKKKPTATRPRRSWRGWMTLTDLVAAVCAIWGVVGGWQETHSIAECTFRAVLIYGGVHVCAPMARGGKS
ncbi:hypothetical protein ABZ686_02310 [Streptomyces sp. NPDC006992]|uniref:hypothetical protein n=1 Tax=Streptomyces sp. NPDC006992 TaxID=3155601 RepID=UPI0033EFA094